MPSRCFLHLLNDVYCVLNQLFEEIWRHHNVGPEGRWPSITNVGQDIPDFPFQLVNTFIIPDMLNGIPALKGQVWGSEEVTIYFTCFCLTSIKFCGYLLLQILEVFDAIKIPRDSNEYVYVAPDYDKSTTEWEKKLNRYRGKKCLCGIIQHWREYVFGKRISLIVFGIFRVQVLTSLLNR